MLTFLRRLLCAAFGHQPNLGVDPVLCIYFHCERCGRLVPGDLGWRQ